MKRFVPIPVLLLIIFSPAYESLQCYITDTYHVELDTEVWEMFKRVLGEPNVEERAYCSGSLTLDSAAGELAIRFGRTKLTEHSFGPSNIQTRVGSSFELPDPEQSSVRVITKTDVTFICKNRDNCDRILLWNYALWLLSGGDSPFLKAIQPLFSKLNRRKRKRHA